MSIVKIDEESSVSNSIVEWNFTAPSGNPWTASSSNFTLKQICNTCSLTISVTSHSNGYQEYLYCSVHVSMTFANCLLMNNIDLIIKDKKDQNKFIFYLTNGCDNCKVYSANKKIHSTSTFIGHAQHSWKLTLIYGSIPRNPEHDKYILYNDLKELLESERHTDFSIKTHNKTFKVHKGILSCRCEVLAKAIESDMIEKKTNEIQLDQWDAAVMKEFLSFIYTGSCEVSMNPHQLFELANYYQLEELKLDCIQYLQSNMNLKNIVHTLALTDEEQYGLGHLRTLALSFVKENEKPLVKDVDFQDYLTQSIDINSLVFVLTLAHQYNLKGPLERAKEFIKQNYEKVLGNEECKTYLSSQGGLLLDILKYIIESSVQV